MLKMPAVVAENAHAFHFALYYASTVAKRVLNSFDYDSEILSLGRRAVIKMQTHITPLSFLHY